MNRCLAFMCALLLAFVSVSSACMAAPYDWISFDLAAQRDRNEIHATFRSDNRGQDRNVWSSGFKPSELIGLDVAGFYTAGSKPVRFAVVREAGRLDCAGSGWSARASGNCNFTADPAFTQLLVSRGIGRPSRNESIGMMALDVHRVLIDSLAAARYPTPKIDDLMTMTAVGVTSGYIAELARVGYRPSSIGDLVQFKALDITPQWIGGLTRIGYANLPSDELVQLKALDITPDFARAAVGETRPLPPVDELVRIRMLGRRR